MTEPLAKGKRCTSTTAASVTTFERHYSAAELAQLWNLDATTIRRMFQDEPGVLRIGKSSRRDGKRDYISIRIPESVVVRVHNERTGSR
jgi:hypothetical protein